MTGAAFRKRVQYCVWVSVAALTLGRTSLAQQACDFSSVDTALANLVAAVAQVPGAGLRIGTANAVLHEAYFGTYDANTVVPTASSAKLLSAIAVMAAVDDGHVTLDQPVATVLPNFIGTKGQMTLRQMFSHTSGLPGGSAWPILGDDTVTLAQAVNAIACCFALDADPGTQFAYGGLSMHVGGRMVEAATGILWDDWFAQRVATPLGLTSVDYEGLGVTDNPRIAGGAQTNLRDYATVLEMLLRSGTHEGERVLSLAAVTEILSDQQMGVPIVEAPDGVGAAGYGLGVWRESFDAAGNPIQISDPGAFGFTPWLEMDRGVYAVIMVNWSRQALLTPLENLQALVRFELDQCDAHGPVPPEIPAVNAFGRVAMVFAILWLGRRLAR